MAIPKNTVYQLGGIAPGYEVIDYSAGDRELINDGQLSAGVLFLTGCLFLAMVLGWQLLWAK